MVHFVRCAMRRFASTDAAYACCSLLVLVVLGRGGVGWAECGGESRRGDGDRRGGARRYWLDPASSSGGSGDGDGSRFVRGGAGEAGGVNISYQAPEFNTDEQRGSLVVLAPGRVGKISGDHGVWVLCERTRNVAS